MYGKIKGVVDEVEGNFVLVRLNSGMCYKIYAPSRTLNGLKPESNITLYLYTHVREQEISLYGVLTKEELNIFNILIGISGVGPKLAMNILGFAQIKELFQAIQNQNLAYFSQIPEVGKKTAQKIMLELSNKFDAEFQLPKKAATQEEKTLLEALLSLGFSRSEALETIAKVSLDLPLEQQITQALKLLNKE